MNETLNQDNLVSLVIPIYNEETHLQEFLTRIDALKLPIEKELVFIDDCSKDSSFQILSQFSFQSSLQNSTARKESGQRCSPTAGNSGSTGKYHRNTGC